MLHGQPKRRELALRVPSDYQVLQHFIEHWGEPHRVLQPPQEVTTPPGPIYIGEFALGPKNRPLRGYATIGMSRASMPYPDGWQGERRERRSELFAFANQANPEVAMNLAWLATYPFRHRTFFADGHTVVGTEGMGFVSGSDLVDVILFAPHHFFQPEAFSQAQDALGHDIDVLMVFPLYPSERVYALTHGWDALGQRLADRETDAGDFRRRAVA